MRGGGQPPKPKDGWPRLRAHRFRAHSVAAAQGTSFPPSSSPPVTVCRSLILTGQWSPLPKSPVVGGRPPPKACKWRRFVLTRNPRRRPPFRRCSATARGPHRLPACPATSALCCTVSSRGCFSDAKWPPVVFLMCIFFTFAHCGRAPLFKP